MESDRRVAHNRRAVPDDLEMLLERIRALIDANAEGAGLPRREVEPTLTEGYARALEPDAECLRPEHRIDRLTMEIAAGHGLPTGNLFRLLRRSHEPEP